MLDRIAVILPAFNEAENIGFALDSLLMQSCGSLSKIIVVDNESTDDTSEVAREALSALSEEQVTVVEQKRYREMGRFNVGFALRRGSCYLPDELDYVAILDADCCLSEDYYCALLGEFRRDLRLGIAGGRIMLKGEGRPESSPWRVNADSMPYGSNRVYRFGCWRDLNQGKTMRVCLTGWDTYHGVLATMRGWHVKRFSDPVSEVLRPTDAVRRLRGIAKGYSRYMMGFPFYWVLYKAVETQDLGMLTGFMQSWLYGLPVLETKTVFHRELAKKLINRTGLSS
jgi:glycosyltransferase involved in cell wall biosynthesis